MLEDSGDYADTEYLYNRLMEPALARALASLNLRAGWRVLDAGSWRNAAWATRWRHVGTTWA
jgi:hypothetical protein